ncbi:hypothetical protein [Microvirga lotononidis]|nr:hypothetical protein [Microvirga lotononidis]WQO31489.1 hypothetical protein U0023_35005 [Microvirga lotononidis]
MSALLGATLSAIAIRPTSAGELYIYEHNLSVIDWFVVGDKIKATYSKPKASLAAAGVKEGAVLFEGTTKETGSSAPHSRSNPAAPLPPIR